ncbi:UNVERIFIED_CONTAM: hypothetical protein RMT77_015384 [Armadillidium vulgare]
MRIVKNIWIFNKITTYSHIRSYSHISIVKNFKVIKSNKCSCYNFNFTKSRVIGPYVGLTCRNVNNSSLRFLSSNRSILFSEKLESNKGSLAEELLSSKVVTSESSTNNEKTSGKTEEDKEKTLRTIKFTFYAFGIMISSLGSFLIYSWGSPQLDATGTPIHDEFSDLPILKQYVLRTIHEAKNMNKMIQEPSRDKLLPDPLKEPYIQPPYTLVLEMKDVLVHPEWTYETGWRFKKRPGVEFLLQHCGPPLFEIVVYTNEQAFTAYPVIEQLDQNNFIWYKLFKDSTRYMDGKHLKDLNCLNRDLNKVIVVDWDKDAITSRRNQLTLCRWKGNMNDQTLVELAMMLRTIAESQVSDVREVLDYYRSFSDPIEAFKENQRVAQMHEEELQKAVKEQNMQKGLTSTWTGSFLKRK